jgi:hypothetical protein
VKRSTAVILALTGAAVVAAGAGIAVWSTTHSPGPSDVAMTYFTALASGDAQAALAVTDIPDAEHGDLTAAYEGAQERVADPRVTETVQSADSAQVVVAYDIGGEPHESALELIRGADGAWALTAVTGRMIATPTIGDASAIGELTVPAGDEVALLPGGYGVDALPRGLVEGAASAVITPGELTTVALEAAVAPAATAAAQEQLDAYAAACTQPAAAVPSNCGIRVPWAADLAALSSIAYRVERLPTVALAEDAATFAATDGIVVATATGTTRDGATGTFTYRTDEWALRGTITFSGNEMVLAVG